MAEELKACPNPWCEAGQCEGDYTPHTFENHFGNWRAACTACSVQGPARASEAEAIAAWNRRTLDPGAVERERWIKPKSIADMPKKPGLADYEYVECLILYKGDLLTRPWNCGHERAAIAALGLTVGGGE